MHVGIGTPQIAERIETRMIERDEGNHIAATGTTVSHSVVLTVPPAVALSGVTFDPRLILVQTTHDWDDAWSDDGEPNPDNSSKDDSNGQPRNRKSVDEERRATEVWFLDVTRPLDPKQLAYKVLY